MPDFAFADADFDRQAIILDKLLEIVDSTSWPLLATENGRTSISELPAGGKNTMAAAAVVLLAAHFEEYVRQQIEEYAKAVIVEYAHLENTFKEKLIDSYWRAGSSKLSRIRPKGSLTWAVEAEPLLRGLVEYPVTGNVDKFKPKYICEHENNMRWETVCELSGRVGIKSLGDQMYRSKNLRDLIGNPRKADWNGALQLRMNEFYELRNGIIHSIAQSAGVGATVFKTWSEFFRIFTTAFATSLDEAFKKFEQDIEVRKRSSARA